MTETEAKWDERVRAWRSSGQPAEDYAEGRGFAASTLRWWSSRFSRGAVSIPPPVEKGTPPVRMMRILPVTRAPAGAVTVRVGAAEFDVRAGFDHVLVRELVEVLGGAQ